MEDKSVRTSKVLRAEIKARERAQWSAVVLVPVAFALGILVGYLYWGRVPSETAKVPVDSGANQQANRVNVSLDGDPSLGPDNAPVTIIEFSDYQCPYCRQWYQEVFPQLMQAYPDKIRFVYRDFPLYGLHPQADPAAQAADCAQDQGKYWEFHDLLFSGGLTLGGQAFTQYASQLGLDTAKFEKCISSQNYQKEVKSDYEYATSLGVRSTPTFFINGIELIGAQPFEAFQQLIDKELSAQ